MTLTLAAAAVPKFFGLIDPRWWFMAVAAGVWLIAWLVRRYLPDVWARAVGRNPALAQLWLVVLSALLSAAPRIGRPLLDLVQGTLLDAILGTVGAQGAHALLRGLPAKVVPYDGAQARVDAAVVRRETPPAGLTALRPPESPPKP